MPPPQSIEEVIVELDRIIDDTVAKNSYLGVFAYVYRRTTAEIKKEVEAGAFEDNPRMQQMDVIFANLYIKAYNDYQNDEQVSQSWKVSFDAGHTRLALMQHLLLGMNAHINLDLAIAANEVMLNKNIQDIANDFRKVNEILANITNEMQSRLGRVSPLLFLLDWIGQRSDEKIADFSIIVAREQSWNIAQQFANLEGQALDQRIAQVDSSVASLAERMRTPRTRVLNWVLNVIKRFETRDKQAIVDALRQ